MSTPASQPETISTEPPSSLQLFGQISRLTWIATASGILLLIVIYFMVVRVPELSKVSGTAYFWAVLLRLLEAIAPNILAAFIGFVASYIVLRPVESLRGQDREARLNANIEKKIDHLAERHEQSLCGAIQQQFREMGMGSDGASFIPDFRDFDFRKQLRGANDVYMVTEFFGGWFEQSITEFETFLRADGRLRVIIPNAANQQLVSAVSKRFRDMDEGEVASKIRATETTLGRLRDDVGATPDQIQIFKYDNPMNYFAFIVDNQYLLLSFFEHSQRGRVASPSVLIRLADHEAVKQWLDRELASLCKAPPPP